MNNDMCVECPDCCEIMEECTGEYVDYDTWLYEQCNEEKNSYT